MVTYTIIHTRHTIALLIVILVALAVAAANMVALAVAAAIHILEVKIMITVVVITIATLTMAVAVDMISSMVHFHTSVSRSVSQFPHISASESVSDSVSKKQTSIMENTNNHVEEILDKLMLIFHIVSEYV